MARFIANSNLEGLIDLRDELNVDRLAMRNAIAAVTRLEPAPAGGIVGLPDDVADDDLIQIDRIALEGNLHSCRFIPALSPNGGNPPALLTCFRMSLIKDHAVADVQRVGAGKPVFISGRI